MAPEIRLQHLTTDLSVHPSTLVHEAAHALHALWDETLTPLWSDRFPNTGRVDDPAFIDVAGYTRAYGATNYNRDEGPEIVHTPGEPLYSVTEREIRIDFLDRVDYDKEVEGLLDEINDLPGILDRSVSHVTYDPWLNLVGSCVPGSVSDGYWDITEDIACSTADFHAAYWLPSGYDRVWRLLLDNEKTRERVRVLSEFGFLDEEMVRVLLSGWTP